MKKELIIWAQDGVIVLNKPAKTHSEAWVEANFDGFKAVHRLDYETSGCLMACVEGKKAYYESLFRGGGEERIKKTYLCGLSGQPEAQIFEAKIWEGFCASRYRSSPTVKFDLTADKFRGWHSVRPVKHEILSDPPASFTADLIGTPVWLRLISGARHQIRSFFSWIGHPLVGDLVYGQRKNDVDNARLELHATQLEFVDHNEQHQIIQAPYLP